MGMSTAISTGSTPPVRRPRLGSRFAAGAAIWTPRPACRCRVAAAIWPLPVAALTMGGIVFVSFSSERRLKYVLLGVAAYTPFEPFILKWLPPGAYFYARFGLYAFLGLAFAVLLGRRLFEGRQVWIWTPIHIPFLLFLCWSFISFAVNDVPLSAAIYSYQPLLRFIVLAFFLVFYIDFKEKDIRAFLALMVAVVIGECLITLAQAAIGEPAGAFLTPSGVEFGGHVVGGMTQSIHGGSSQIFGTLGRYNILGAFLGIFFLLTLPFFLDARPKPASYFFLYAVLLPSVFLAAARSAWLGIAIGVWIIALSRNPFRAVVLLILVSLSLVAAFGAIATSAEYFGTEGAGSLQRALEPFSPRYREVSGLTYGRLFWILEFPQRLLAEDPRAFFVGYGPGA